MTPPTPFTDDDNALLALYLDPGVALFALCDELHITYSELERRLNQPHIREAITRAERLHQDRAKTLARCQTDDTVATLHHIASHPDHNPETRRKAATILQRMATPNASEGITTPAKTSVTTATVKKRTTSLSPPTHAHPAAPSPPGRGRLTCASRQPGEGSPSRMRSTPHPQVPIAQCQVPPPTTHAYHLTPFTHPRTTRTDNPRPP